VLQILEEHKQQGVEDQALERGDEGKKAAAKKRATKPSDRLPFFLATHSATLFFSRSEETSIAGGGQR